MKFAAVTPAFIICICLHQYHTLASPSFNIIDFGAHRDSDEYSTQGLEGAFQRACKTSGSQVYIPQGTFLVGSARFEGPCAGPITVRIDGVLRAPAGPSSQNSWLAFRIMDGLTITGSGKLDGWGPNVPSKTITMRLDFLNNSLVEHINLVNSKGFHINVLGCLNVHLRYLTIRSRWDSPTSDGIHVGDSKYIKIYDSDIHTGDDCVSLGPGSTHIKVHDIRCGPGHGISIGSLGRYTNEADVYDISVHNCNLSHTLAGLRIKTWATPLKSKAHKIRFESIKMIQVRNPILIDQYYCPAGNCHSTTSSAVEIYDVRFTNIWGTSVSRSPVQFNCSKSHPCVDIRCTNIKLFYRGKM